MLKRSAFRLFTFCAAALLGTFATPPPAGAQPCAVPYAPSGLRVIGTAPPSPQPAPAPIPCDSGGTLRVMTWNIKNGRNLNDVYSLPAQIQFMAAQNVHVIGLQEVGTWEGHHTSIPELLRQATGATWSSVWAPSGPCQSGGGCLGQLILTRLPVVSQATTYILPSSAARMQITIGGVPVQFFATHLEAFDLNVRTTQLNQFMAWARGFGGPALVVGDFNSWWGEWWIQQMTSEYYDTWKEISGINDQGYTIGNVRFDYVFRSMTAGARLTPLSCIVPSTTLSDHRPVVAEFRVQ
jgi:endonuclease/exonuclease/phosphatase family metal-dependent hydrolase